MQKEELPKRIGIRQYEGFLHKKSPKSIMGMHRWQGRYFVLFEDRFEYYRSKEDSQPIGSIPISFILNVTLLSDKRGGARFDVTIDGDSERVFSLLAETAAICRKWVKELNLVLALNARKPNLNAKVMVGGKTPWKNKELIRSSNSNLQKYSAMEESDTKLPLRARDHGYVCGRLLQTFSNGYGFVYQASKLRKRLSGILHIVPKDGPNYELTHKYFLSQLDLDRPFFPKAQIAGTTSDASFIIYDHGLRSLFAHLKAKGYLNESKVRNVGAEVALALRAIHEEGLTFPNLRPENIFLTSRGHVRLVDLWHNSGVSQDAYMLEDIASEYVAPDYLEEKKDDALSDWWRLGVLLYELTCGIPPFHSLVHDRNEVLDKIRRYKDLVSSLQFPRDASMAIKGFISSLLTPRSSRERFLTWSNVESDPFFRSIDFDQLWKREEEVKASSKTERKRSGVDKISIKVSLLAARDLRFGKCSNHKSLTLGIKSEHESSVHVTAPVIYSETSLEFNERNQYIIEQLTDKSSLHIFADCHDGKTEDKITGQTHVKFAEIWQGCDKVKGAKVVKWVDVLSSDSRVIGDVKIEVLIDSVETKSSIISSNLSYEEFFEILKDGNVKRSLSLSASRGNGENCLLGAGEKIRKILTTNHRLSGDHYPESKRNLFKGAKTGAKKNRRFQKDGFDLDLSYITQRLIAFGFPAKQSSGSYRNNVTEVNRFLNYFHPSKHKVYNLCVERKYPEGGANECCESYAFNEEDVPELQSILDFCLDVDAYLTEDEKNVVAVTCSYGKERTGLMISCYMLFAEIFPSHRTALDFFASQRTQDNFGVSSPSHVRYVSYFERYLREYHLRSPPIVMDFNGKPVILYHIRVSLIKGERLNFQVSDIKNRILYEHITKKPQFNLEVKTKYAECSCHVPLSGDQKITFYTGKRCDNPVCWIWINTNFIKDNFAGFSRNEVDGAASGDLKAFPPKFKMELYFLSREEMAITAPHSP